MAGTTGYYGISYPTNTDYVKDGAAAMQTIATGFDSAVAIPTYNNQTGTSYTFALLDAAKVVSSNNAAAVTFTIPPQASVVWTTGATLTVANYGAGSVTVAGGVGVTVTNSTATVAQYGSASIIRTGSNAWTVIPFAGGAANLSDSAISGTTGSPTTGTYTSGGVNYKTYSFTGTGSITFSKQGLIDVVAVAGGGASGSMSGAFNYLSGGGGAGGYLAANSFLVSASAFTVTIGAGGTSDGNGTNSFFGIVTCIGGGAGGTGSDGSGTAGKNGGSGGGGGSNNGGLLAGGTALSNQGNVGAIGGAAGTGGAGSGGGASGAGNTQSGNGVTVAGGLGTASSITGTSVTRAVGGRAILTADTSPAAAAGGANTGNGGDGGAKNSSSASRAGGSGVVIVRVLA